MVRSYFNKEAISDLTFSLNREYLQTSVAGAYAASTILGCNTRKYHGLLVVPQPAIDDDNHVFLSSINESIKYKDQIHQLNTQKYPGVYFPEGYKYYHEFVGSPIPKWTYHIDDCIITKELLIPPSENTVYIRYILVDAGEKIEISLSPFLAFRNMHHLCKANLHVNKKVRSVENGIKIKLYPQYADLYIQCSQNPDFIAAPDWYYNVEYQEELNRGYDYREDLFVPGQFNLKLKKGEQLVLSASLEEGTPKTFKSRFSNLLKKKHTPSTITESLTEAAKQFIIKAGESVEIKAGYYWFGRWGRDTFISLPGLTLATGHPKVFKSVIDAIIPTLKNGLFPNAGKGKNASYNSVDAPLWFVWALQQYAEYTGKDADIWKEYSKPLIAILDNYKKGTLNNIKMDTDGLISQGQQGKALTWMDSVVNGEAMTPRIGKPVEINALWYNAICFCLACAEQANDDAFAEKWDEYPAKIKESFITAFWDEEKGYLADLIKEGKQDWSLRPNQVIAMSVPYSPVPPYLFQPIIEKVTAELLTPRGLRTLSSKDPAYIGIYKGDQAKRDKAYHQGIVWPWLLGPFAEACLKADNNRTAFVQELYEGFEPALEEKSLYTIPELYNGDFPHEAAGAVSQAWSVAELLRIHYLLKEYKKDAAKHLIEKEEEK